MLSPSDADIIRRDSALPGLGILLDPEAFAAEVRQALGGATTASAADGYVRYKPGYSCLVSYSVSMGNRSVQVFAKALRRTAYDKIMKYAVGPVAAGPRGVGRVVREERAVAFMFFPNDRRLPALARLAETESRRELLQKMLPTQPSLWDGQLDVLRYKPERRWVAALSTAGGPRAVVKLYDTRFAPPDTARRFRSGEFLRTARRLRKSGRHRALFFEWLPGRLLSDEFSHHAVQRDDIVRVGHALAELHAQPIEKLPLRTRGDEVEAIAANARYVGFLHPLLAEQAQTLAERVAERLIARPSPGRPVHGDFYDKQILLDGRQVGVIDLDEAARGEPSKDIGRFFARRRISDMIGGEAPSRDWIADALADGYRRGGGSWEPERITLYTAAALLHAASFGFRRRFADWADMSASVLNQAQALLDGRG